GVPAVVAAARHSLVSMGTTRSIKLLGSVNQRDGFDCPGCAWPDPKGDRSFAEFCENGAKAVAEEATKARAGPALFASHSVAELSRHSDHWLGQQGRLTHPLILRSGSEHYEEISYSEAFDLIA